MHNLKEIPIIRSSSDAVRNEYQGSYVATGIVQKRDVSIIYSVILYMLTPYNHESYYNNSISHPALGAGLETG